MISSVDQKQEMICFITDQLSVIKEYGFKDAIVTDGSLITTIDWLNDGIALEVELDWRGLDIFMLLVRLEDGKLPKGYYVSNGKPCRFHLQKVVKERHWRVNQEAFRGITSGTSASKRRNLTTDDLKERFKLYKAVLMSCLDKLIAEKDLIFSP